jgi:hypothetical protein
MKTTLALLGVAAWAALAIHAQSRFVTLAIGKDVTSDSLNLATHETARLLSKFDRSGSWQIGDGRGYLKIERYGLVLTEEPLLLGPSPTVTGPAKITVFWWTQPNPANPPAAAFATLEVMPASFPPDKTVMVPAGTGANIILEASSDLVRWTPADPGAYTNRTDNLFFRIRAERIP